VYGNRGHLLCNAYWLLSFLIEYPSEEENRIERRRRRRKKKEMIESSRRKSTHLNSTFTMTNMTYIDIKKSNGNLLLWQSNCHFRTITFLINDNHEKLQLLKLEEKVKIDEKQILKIRLTYRSIAFNRIEKIRNIKNIMTSNKKKPVY